MVYESLGGYGWCMCHWVDTGGVSHWVDTGGVSHRVDTGGV